MCEGVASMKMKNEEERTAGSKVLTMQPFNDLTQTITLANACEGLPKLFRLFGPIQATSPR